MNRRKFLTGAAASGILLMLPAAPTRAAWNARGVPSEPQSGSFVTYEDYLTHKFGLSGPLVMWNSREGLHRMVVAYDVDDPLYEHYAVLLESSDGLLHDVPLRIERTAFDEHVDKMLYLSRTLEDVNADTRSVRYLAPADQVGSHCWKLLNEGA